MRTAIVAALAAAFATPVPAQTPGTPRIDQRQQNQERVQKMEDKAATDGKVGAKERAQDKQSRRIYRQKHDRQRAK